MSPTGMKTISEQQARQVAAIESSATLLHVLFTRHIHLKVALLDRSAEGLLTWHDQHWPSHQTQLPAARISPHHDVPASFLAPSPPVVPVPVHGSRRYCRHRMESASLLAKE